MEDIACLAYNPNDECEDLSKDSPAHIQPKAFGSSNGMIQVDLETDDEDGNHADNVPHNPGRDIMSRFFDTWDEDDSGFLDVKEVLQGVEKFCDSMDLDYDSRRVSALFKELDADGNQELDRKEFTFFLRKYADMNDIGMEDLAYVMATDEQMAPEPEVVEHQRRVASNPTVFFTNLFSAMILKREDDAKRAAEVKRAAAAEEPTKPSPQKSLATFFSLFGRKEIEEEEEETVSMWDTITNEKDAFAEAALEK
eukprot:CAMPEP_0119016382 /NCGR_PEP_ID=MMETSP1176-20130426/12479_1 /TAXON_ID=265551 /ORGANISM="Synedropsis recta cf, Strain CCMP1620" /LENGTH=252 /DNA_ID=CAMNT_0006969761 /DNA_START=88 /DNA_END=846 /DNA_ORIENTATION=-